MRRALLASGAVATLGIAGFLTAGSASAETETSAAANGRASLIERLAERFQLDTSEVQKVFDEEREARHAQRESAMKERLAAAVSDGELTQAESEAIIAKHTEMHEFIQTLSDKTTEERREAIQKQRADMRQWAQDNDIPLSYLRLGGHHRSHGHAMRGLTPAEEVASQAR